ncbi:MAG: hypothetical protein M5U19_09335 [Microthrixaceae bacterium]|nr:hypothetical protein [Microthrixaceae bacterium]
MSSLESLLSLQEIDTRLDQLRHRRETLTERTELAAAQDVVASTDAAVAATFAELSEVRSAREAPPRTRPPASSRRLPRSKGCSTAGR